MTNPSKFLSPVFVLFLISCNAPNNKEPEISELPPVLQIDRETEDEVEEVSFLPSKPVKGIISSKGFENVTFGMTETEVKAAFKGHLEKDYDPEYPECYYLSVDNADISFMIYSGTLQRIDIYGSTDIETEQGAVIGMNFESVERLYPNTLRKPNFYTFPSEDLIVQLERNVKIIFEQSTNETIRHFRVGTVPSIDFVEGCL